MDHVRRPKLTVVRNAQRLSCAKIFLSLPTSMLHGALKVRRSLWFLARGLQCLVCLHSDDLDPTTDGWSRVLSNRGGGTAQRLCNKQQPVQANMTLCSVLLYRCVAIGSQVTGVASS
jgi:hypothetical protein